MKMLIAYGTTLAVLLGLDFVWLKYAADAFFRARIGDVLTETPNYAAAALFYVFFSVGLVVYAVAPALNGGGLRHAALNGAFLGFLAYMAFDLTCLAILTGWRMDVAVIDMAWGTIVSCTAACAGYWITAVATAR